MKNEHKKIPKSKILVVISGVAIALFLFGLVREKINSAKVEKEITNLENQIGSFERENGELSKLINEWQGSNRIEREARLKLGLKKPGENVVIIMKDDGGSSTVPRIREDSEIIANLVKNKETAGKSNPGKWWHYFFKTKY